MHKQSFTVEVFPDALIVRGSIPFDRVSTICKLGDADFRIQPDLASRLGASLVACNQAGFDRLNSAAPPRQSSHLPQSISPALLNWYQYGEHGLSSCAMFNVAVGLPQTLDHPRDASDFGRCVKLVDAAPEVRNAFSAIAALSQEWFGIIELWVALEKAYRANEFNFVTMTLQRLLAK
jgi:hypothetical protein